MEYASMPRLHAESDVAAVVYGADDDPDGLLRGFLDRRIAQGHDALGVVQSRAAIGSGRLRTAAFHLLPDFEWGSPTFPTRPQDPRCAAALTTIGERLNDALTRRPDVLVLNRFGRGGSLGRRPARPSRQRRRGRRPRGDRRARRLVSQLARGDPRFGRQDPSRRGGTGNLVAIAGPWGEPGKSAGIGLRTGEIAAGVGDEGR